MNIEFAATDPLCVVLFGNNDGGREVLWQGMGIGNRLCWQVQSAFRASPFLVGKEPSWSAYVLTMIHASVTVWDNIGQCKPEVVLL